MNKALQDIPEGALAGFISLTSDRELFEQLIAAANNGDELALNLIHRLWRYGATTPFLRQIEENVKGIRFDTHPKLDEKRNRFYWKRTYPFDQQITRLAAYSMIVLLAVNRGTAERVKRCEGNLKVDGKYTTCDNYFSGFDNKQFCSKRCAGRARVQKKRKLDRQSGRMA